MPRVEVREDESLEKALRRFKRMLEREGTLKVLKARKHYEKPSERRRREMRQSMSRRARAAAFSKPPVRPGPGGRSL
jgi:small subunit ribosomal protein S21